MFKRTEISYNYTQLCIYYIQFIVYYFQAYPGNTDPSTIVTNNLPIGIRSSKMRFIHWDINITYLQDLTLWVVDLVNPTTRHMLPLYRCTLTTNSALQVPKDTWLWNLKYWFKDITLIEYHQCCSDDLPQCCSYKLVYWLNLSHL